MKIALHDADKTSFPNLALMKLSAYHKSLGDDVDWYTPMFNPGEKVYSSKVFTYTPDDLYLPVDAERGGIGYGIMVKLPDEIEHICPDYDLYKLNYSLGFVTRGCPRNCEWCFVQRKEGGIRSHADVDEFVRHDDVVLMDNNILAHDHGIRQLEKIAQRRYRVDVNQGIDARLIDEQIAQLFSRIKWLHPVRLACDHIGQMKHVAKAVELLRWHNVTPRTYFCYVLVKDVDDAVERVKFLKGLGIDPFAQPFRDAIGTQPTQEQRDFARWVNHKAEFKSRTWEQYRDSHHPAGGRGE